MKRLVYDFVVLDLPCPARREVSKEWRAIVQV